MNPCPICVRSPEPFTWTVCFKTEPHGYFRHEHFFFGPGSPTTEEQARRWAEAWAADHMLQSWPDALLRDIVKVVPAGAVAR